ncbi:MAG: DEAD/DEAH box helicase family protein [Bifidobacteriaceae bacterium]|jgi:type I restriction enzyme R subunit|nr:DEAD/DEAH box helicase family protein [Bifidobacteriaceae bacterium]
MIFNENSRVKIPALVHLTRLGYNYLSLKDATVKSQLDSETNILTNIFKKQVAKFNSGVDESEIDRMFVNLRLELSNDNLGREFYERLINTETNVTEGKLKLIDFTNLASNTYHVVTELTYGQEDSDNFRPDITLFINGMPLAFIEVKKPNNTEGIKAERDRINVRFKNEKFRKYINITQLMVFSNNMPYDDTGQNQLEGAFYATTAKSEAMFNNFREELPDELEDCIKPINGEIENFILSDNNLQPIKHNPEYLLNKSRDMPTNSILTSLFVPHRLLDFLHYGIAYVEYPDEDTGETKLEKHIMRYPQFFATKAIKRTLKNNEKQGVIWHTQGSGKTALAYFNVRYLADYFAKKGVATQFYFIVDRLDLLTQAKDEFSWRGMPVDTVQNRDELAATFRYNASKPGITIVNIQKFDENAQVKDDSGYEYTVQRIYFLDEAHRSYDPRGSYLADLYNSDKNSIKIALTGTPLITYKEHATDEEGEKAYNKKQDRKTTVNIFGNYIHKYFYNDSIKDGYTIQLVREEIETSYRTRLNEIVKNMELKLGILKKKLLYAHEKFVSPMLNYIIADFKNSRIRFGDYTIGAMVVCDSSDQAREMFRQFKEQEHGLTAALILHNEDDKETRKIHTKAFRKGNLDEILNKKVDVLFVYNMLLTGFDAPRLKKLYLGRKIGKHNLLQTLTRVNRPYANFRVGYVVDFADITEQFNEANNAYFRELNAEYGDNLDGESAEELFASLVMGKDTIDEKVESSNNVLSPYEATNMETFSNQMTGITDRNDLYAIRKALIELQDVYNAAKTRGYVEIMNKYDFKKFATMLKTLQNRISLLNFKDTQNSEAMSHELLNLVMEDLRIQFTKIKEEDLKLVANDYEENITKVREEVLRNWNEKDPTYVSLFEEFVRLLNKSDMRQADYNIDEMKRTSHEWNTLLIKFRELNRQNSLISDKFNGDKKAARVYMTADNRTERFPQFNLSLITLIKTAKDIIDEQVTKNRNMLSNSEYAKDTIAQAVWETYDKSDKTLSDNIVSAISEMMAKEYADEYKGEK